MFKSIFTIYWGRKFRLFLLARCPAGAHDVSLTGKTEKMLEWDLFVESANE